MSWGRIPYGLGTWGIPHQPNPPINPYVSIINVLPTPGSYNIARNQTFTFTIKTKFALSATTTYVMLDNKLVINGTFFDSVNFTIIINTNIDGISKDYSITPNYLMKDGSAITLQISATDVYGNPAAPFWAGYLIVDSRPKLISPIYPLDRATEIPLDLTLHFLVNQLAAPGTGLDSTTLNVLVNGDAAISNGFIQSSFGGVFSALTLPPNITDPFEVLLDFEGRYEANSIVTINVSVKELTIVPITGINGNILDANGVLVGQNVIINTVNKLLSNAEYSLILAAPLTTYLLPGIIVMPGYKIQDTSGNIFNIAVVGVQELIISTVSKLRSGAYSFVTEAIEENLVAPVFAGYFQGVYFVDNIGDGYHLNVTWHPARTSRPDNDLAYLIYYSIARSDVFYEEPKLITQGRKLPNPETIHGADAQLYGYFAQIPLPVGTTYYFGIRATEYPHSTIPFIPADGYGSNALGRNVVDGYSFAIPIPQTLLTATVGSGAIAISVTTTIGYASTGGYVTVGTEIMRYSGITNTTFIIAPTGRGLFGSFIQNNHNVGELVRMYYGNHDDNSIIDKNVVLWEPPYDPKRMRPDLITTDFTLEDGYNASFEGFDYCGYHNQYPDLLFTDKQCNTYVGGDYNGSLGLYLTERQMAVEEQLLSVTGEAVVLLRRIWQGETCICRTSRKDSSMVRSCAICFGTGFKKGFIQYLNPRENSMRILLHFSPNDEDIGMGAQSGWQQNFKPNAWTLNVPSIKDRDLIVRFDYENKNQINWIYIVNNVSRGETIFGSATRQKLNLSRLDRTDVVYQFKFIK